MGRVDSMSGGKSCRIVWTASKDHGSSRPGPRIRPVRQRVCLFLSGVRADSRVRVDGQADDRVGPLPLETIGRGKPVERRRIAARNLALSLA